MTSNPLHSSKSAEWYTPDNIVQFTKLVMPKIDLDPASCLKANETIGATAIYTKERDALSSSWGTDPKSVFMNPPSGRVKLNPKFTVSERPDYANSPTRSLPALFWERLLWERRQGYIEDAIVIAFSIEQLAVTQSCTEPMADFMFCIPSKRIKFTPESGKATAPTHASVVIYVPGLSDNTELFAEVFRHLGSIVNK